MTFSAMGSPSDPLVHRPVVGVVPAEPDVPEDGRGPEWERWDDIVQRLFAIGLAMQISRQLCGDRPELAARITGHMNDLQGMIHQIRSAVPAPVPLRPGSYAD